MIIITANTKEDLTLIDYSQYKDAYLSFKDDVVLRRKDSKIKVRTIKIGDIFIAQDVLQYVENKMKTPNY